jgi:hypothetical protein
MTGCSPLVERAVDTVRDRGIRVTDAADSGRVVDAGRGTGGGGIALVSFSAGVAARRVEGPGSATEGGLGIWRGRGIGTGTGLTAEIFLMGWGGDTASLDAREAIRGGVEGAAVDGRAF